MCMAKSPNFSKAPLRGGPNIDMCKPYTQKLNFALRGLNFPQKRLFVFVGQRRALQLPHNSTKGGGGPKYEKIKVAICQTVDPLAGVGLWGRPRVIGDPFKYYGWEGYHWIELNE